MENHLAIDWILSLMQDQKPIYYLMLMILGHYNILCIMCTNTVVLWGSLVFLIYSEGRGSQISYNKIQHKD